MNYEKTPLQIPAPCIIDSGIIINKDDIRRLLNDLSRVHYIHTLDGQVQSEGDGWVIEIFSDPKQATLVANNTLYINTHSFDYLQLNQSPERKTYYDLRQDNRQLRLIPLTNCSQDKEREQKLDEAALEEMLNQVLAAKWDVQIDDDDSFF